MDLRNTKQFEVEDDQYINDGSPVRRNNNTDKHSKLTTINEHLDKNPYGDIKVANVP